MGEIFVTIRIKLKWLYAAITATKEQCSRDHYSAAIDPDPKHKVMFRAMADAQAEASKGLKEAVKKIEDDHE